MFTVRETGASGLIILEPKLFRDDRGYFFENYRRSVFEEIGLHQDFVQDNQSRSLYGVIRGIHYQKEPHAQAKLVRVADGTIFDVAVDLRESSPTFGKWFGYELSETNQLQLFIPGGFAHGFSVLSPSATVIYKCDAYYHPAAEAGIRFDDPDLRIDWKIDPLKAVISDKDRNLPYFKEIKPQP